MCYCIVDELLPYSDMDKVHTGIGDRLSTFIQWTTSFFGGVIVGFIYDWRLTLVMLGAAPFMVASAAFLVRVSTKLHVTCVNLS